MAQYELNLKDYVRILRKRKLVILITFVAIAAFSYHYSSRQIPMYEARATIKIAERKTIAGLLTEEIMYIPGNIMYSAASLITGFPVLKRVAFRLGLAEEGDPIPKIQAAVAGLGGIRATPVKSTNIIEIAVVSHDPERAMLLANTVAEVYVEENLLEKNKESRTVRKFIEEQLLALEERLREVEERLRALSNEVEDIRITPAIQDKLMDLQFELLAYLQRYTEKHPLVKKVSGQIKELEMQLEGFSGNELEYSRLSREAEVSKKLYMMLKEKLEEARITEAQKINDVSIVNPAVFPGGPIGTQKETGIIIGALLGLILGIALAFVRESMDTSIGTIEDVEGTVKLSVLGIIPSIVHKVSKRRSIFIKVRNRFFPSQNDPDDEVYIRMISHHESASPVSEAFRNIRTNLKLDPTRKTILVTSAAPREGKTTVLVNLGLTVAQTGAKTLLVSTDLRRPALARTFGIEREPGLSEALIGAVKLDDALRNVTDIMLGSIGVDHIIKSPGLGNISILPSGQLPNNPAEILESEKMHGLIEELKKRFDFVFFDSPPILPVTDASLLAPKLDGVVLCYEMGRTSRDALIRAKMQLQTVGAKILGVVLNHISPQTESLSPYPYYYRYKYRYYREEAQGSKKDKSKKG
ncbi:polysaccharide biosynthesis tyrosine autokinase [Candidatus Omnitrophota bacterium]